jgi:hypothetical protein
MKRLLAFAIFSAVFVCVASLCPGQVRQSPIEQRSFGAEDQNFEHTVSLPSTVLDILRKQDEVKDALDMENVPFGDPPSTWFLASEVHLAGPNEKDIVVMGKCPVCGANVVPFWVFRPDEHGHELILAAGGLGLTSLPIAATATSKSKPGWSRSRSHGRMYGASTGSRINSHRARSGRTTPTKSV